VLKVNVGVNDSGAERSGIVSINDQPVIIQQSGAH
jgi:hypothetical protein